MTAEETRTETRWTEHLARACDALAAELRSAVPGEFSSHARGSVREALLAMRSLLDAGIEHLDKPSRPTARKVDIE